MKEKIGIGIIGSGFARRVQIPAFLACENAEVVSVASGRLANAKETTEEFKIGHFTDNWRETVSRADVDLVCITTPPSLHREMTLFAIENRKHILCEKPMAMTTAEAREMTEKAKKAPILALIDHELRFQSGRQTAREMLRNGEIGKVRHAKYNFRAPHRGDPNLPWNLWSDINAGGGALGAITSHIIDSFHWFLDADISHVFCQLQTHIKERRGENGELQPVTADDESNLVLRFGDSNLTSDATGLISVSMTENPKYHNRMEFFGTDGAMRVDHRGELYVAKTGETDWRSIDVGLGEPVESVADTGFSRGFMDFAPKIIEAIREGKTQIRHAATFEDGLTVQIVLDAARESNKSGCVVKI